MEVYMAKNWRATGLTPFFTDIDTVQKRWGSFLALGILLIVLGIASIGFSVFVTEFSVIVFGLILIGAGITQIIQSFWARKWSGLLLALLLGILYIVTGAVCVAKPIVSALSLTLLIAAFCFVGGLFRMISSAIMRFEQWGWVFFNGLVTFLLGLIIFADWPVSGLWVIGLFVGIDMLMLGWTWVILSLAAKEKQHA
jgi:uncharacterized membrane protein HdeD (DUF308 family)